MTPSDDSIEQIRDFNRFYTRVIGALGEGHLRTEYSLTEARVIYELGRDREVEATEVRTRLDMDPGQFSRLLSRFESNGLITRKRSAIDNRRGLIRLTEQGRTVRARLDGRANDSIAALIGDLDSGARERLVAAMRTVRTELDRSGLPAPRIRGLRRGDLGWVVQRNADIYAAEFDWDDTYEALVARIVADYAEHRDPDRDAGWIAEIDGRRAGCVFCVHDGPGTARLRLLLVEPFARGTGVGTALVDTCLDFARSAGYHRITLWTNDVLTSARRIYERAGFTLDATRPHHSFGHDLVGQDWSRNLP